MMFYYSVSHSHISIVVVRRLSNGSLPALWRPSERSPNGSPTALQRLSNGSLPCSQVLINSLPALKLLLFFFVLGIILFGAMVYTAEVPLLKQREPLKIEPLDSR